MIGRREAKEKPLPGTSFSCNVVTCSCIFCSYNFSPIKKEPKKRMFRGFHFSEYSSLQFPVSKFHIFSYIFQNIFGTFLLDSFPLSPIGLMVPHDFLKSIPFGIMELNYNNILAFFIDIFN